MEALLLAYTNVLACMWTYVSSLAFSCGHSRWRLETFLLIYGGIIACVLVWRHYLLVETDIIAGVRGPTLFHQLRRELKAFTEIPSYGLCCCLLLLGVSGCT